MTHTFYTGGIKTHAQKDLLVVRHRYMFVDGFRFVSCGRLHEWSEAMLVNKYWCRSEPDNDITGIRRRNSTTISNSANDIRPLTKLIKQRATPYCNLCVQRHSAMRGSHFLIVMAWYHLPFNRSATPVNIYVVNDLNQSGFETPSDNAYCASPASECGHLFSIPTPWIRLRHTTFGSSLSNLSTSIQDYFWNPIRNKTPRAQNFRTRLDEYEVYSALSTRVTVRIANWILRITWPVVKWLPLGGSTTWIFVQTAQESTRCIRCFRALEVRIEVERSCLSRKQSRVGPKTCVDTRNIDAKAHVHWQKMRVELLPQHETIHRRPRDQSLVDSKDALE